MNVPAADLRRLPMAPATRLAPLRRTAPKQRHGFAQRGGGSHRAGYQLNTVSTDDRLNAAEQQQPLTLTARPARK